MTDSAATPDCPHRRDGVVVRVDETGSALCDEGVEVAAINDSALAVWELCDGRTTVDEIVAAIGVFFNAEPGVIRRDVLATLAHLRGLDVVR